MGGTYFQIKRVYRVQNRMKEYHLETHGISQHLKTEKPFKSPERRKTGHLHTTK